MQAVSVGVWYLKSIELPVTILCILKAVATYVPLDREMPQERNSRFLQIFM